MQKAFTLVELAIVLVIVGLIVGGILVGTDLIKTAAIRNYMKGLNDYSAAATTFRNKYRFVPGDIKATYAVTFALTTRAGTVGEGDGNGAIEGCAASSYRLGCETALFWRDLSDAQLIATPYVTATDIPVDGTVGGFNLTAYVPSAPFRNSTYTIIYAPNNTNYYYVGAISSVSVNGTITSAAGLTAIEAESIDQKMDDDGPATGSVRAMTAQGTFDTGGAAGATQCYVNTSTPMAYNLASAYANNVNCQLRIRTPF